MNGPQDAYDGPLSTLRSCVDDLGAWLAIWQGRDDSKPQPEVRRAANTAIDAIDAMLQALHAIRARLITEVRVSDDATAARADALLARTDDAIKSSPGPTGPRETEGPGARTPGPAHEKRS